MGCVCVCVQQLWQTVTRITTAVICFTPFETMWGCRCVRTMCTHYTLNSLTAQIYVGVSVAYVCVCVSVWHLHTHTHTHTHRQCHMSCTNTFTHLAHICKKIEIRVVTLSPIEHTIMDQLELRKFGRFEKYKSILSKFLAKRKDKPNFNDLKKIFNNISIYNISIFFKHFYPIAKLSVRRNRLSEKTIKVYLRCRLNFHIPETLGVTIDKCTKYLYAQSIHNKYTRRGSLAVHCWYMHMHLIYTNRDTVGNVCFPSR